jgi:CBS-domain-containing membrane protein
MEPSAPARHSVRAGAIACAGIGGAIGALAYGSFELGVLLVLGSFGSSAVLLFAYADSPFAQPRSIIGGHVISSAVGLLVLALAGRHWWALGLAVALAAALMMAARSVHPPAGSNPIIVFLAMPDWHFLLFPTLAGALALVAIGVLYHRACALTYPRYWLGAAAPAPRTADASERA